MAKVAGSSTGIEARTAVSTRGNEFANRHLESASVTQHHDLFSTSLHIHANNIRNDHAVRRYRHLKQQPDFGTQYSVTYIGPVETRNVGRDPPMPRRWAPVFR
jgi:hypothetical protein